MTIMQPITIQCDTFVCTIYDIGILMRMPLASIRKMWKIMFSAEDENSETIQTIRDWLPVNVENTARRTRELQAALRQSAQETECLRCEVAVFGSIATKEQKAAHATAQRQLKAAEKAVRTAKAACVKAQKLQDIFNEMSKN